MALIKTVCGLSPKWGKNCYFSENATIVGDVSMGDDCTVWFNAVVRGDVNYIRIGNRVNIQDGSCLHTLYKKAAIEIGDDVTIGHNVTLHGCKVKSGALIGMGAVLLDKDEPWRVLRRSKDYLLAPAALYELTGDVPDVVFPCAALTEGDKVCVYYGAADTCVGIAFGRISEILDWLKKQ